MSRCQIYIHISAIATEARLWLVHFDTFSYTFQVGEHGAVVRALSSHRCGRCSIPGPGVSCWLSLFLFLVLAPKGVFSEISVFLLSSKTNTPNSKSALIHVYL